MFRDAIPGMDKVFQTEPPEGSVILIVGCAGTLKSAFTYNLIANSMAKRPTDLTQCIFVSLEETRASLLRNIKTMGIVPSERIQIADMASFMKEIDQGNETISKDEDYTNIILEKASRPLKIYQNKEGSHNKITQRDPGEISAKPRDLADIPALRPTIFVLDSLNALNSVIYRASKNLRKDMAHFMFKLREKSVTSFIVMEVGDPKLHRPEHFLVDGIIELGMMETEPRKFKRYMKVQKMRATKHSIEPFLIEVTEEGIKVVEELI
jgi:KaiC/GvpD/RAD55 family RecA-like ATPase